MGHEITKAGLGVVGPCPDPGNASDQSLEQGEGTCLLLRVEGLTIVFSVFTNVLSGEKPAEEAARVHSAPPHRLSKIDIDEHDVSAIEYPASVSVDGDDSLQGPVILIPLFKCFFPERARDSVGIFVQGMVFVPPGEGLLATLLAVLPGLVEAGV
jgi:hypothetical protein